MTPDQLLTELLRDVKVYRWHVEDVEAQRQQAERELSELVQRARDEGATWQAIGDTLGITRQGAQYLAERYESA